jgi:hypothetical protein
MDEHPLQLKQRTESATRHSSITNAHYYHSIPFRLVLRLIQFSSEPNFIPLLIITHLQPGFSSRTDVNYTVLLSVPWMKGKSPGASG